jgi:multicomponent Na+:H+ antiporter subunit E
MSLASIRTGAVRLLLFGALWTVLAGDWSHPVMAIVTVSGSVAASLFLWPRLGGHLRWRGVPSLTGYFLWQALMGGIDVARRVLSPSLPVSPDVIEYDSRIESRGGQVLFVWMIGLMPGTASVGWHDDGRVIVHVIDQHRYEQGSLRKLESRLRAVFPP